MRSQLDNGDARTHYGRMRLPANALGRLGPSPVRGDEPLGAASHGAGPAIAGGALAASDPDRHAAGLHWRDTFGNEANA